MYAWQSAALVLLLCISLSQSSLLNSVQGFSALVVPRFTTTTIVRRVALGGPIHGPLVSPGPFAHTPVVLYSSDDSSSSENNDKNTDDANVNETSDIDEQKLERQRVQEAINAMMMPSSSTDLTPNTNSWINTNNNDNGEDAVYNAVPLFTGTIITVLSMALTGYLLYAGITGDDPLTGHPAPL